jgi:hypothetical protein
VLVGCRTVRGGQDGRRPRRFTGLPVLDLPGRDLLSTPRPPPARMGAALAVRVNPVSASPVTVATSDGLLLRTLPPEALTPCAQAGIRPRLD